MVRQRGSSEEEAASEGQGDHRGGGPQQGRQAQEEGTREAYESDQGDHLTTLFLLSLTDLKIHLYNLTSDS